MPTHNFAPLKGRLERFVLSSHALEGNLLGDPQKREVAVYLPESYQEGKKDYPLIVLLSGYWGSGLGAIAWSSFSETLPVRVERLIAEGKMGEVIIAFPDCFTSLGGTQYINSPVTGRWADYLIQELVPYLERHYRVRPGAEHRGVVGKSSGGYGALAHGMKYGDKWGAIASHSGDVAFDFRYLTDLSNLLISLQEYGDSFPSFVESMRAIPYLERKHTEILLYASLAAQYDPDERAPYGVRFPVTLDTCEIIPERWSNWVSWDPLTLIEQADCQNSLRKLKGIYIDCGVRDEHGFIFGTRRLGRRLRELGIAYEYEELDAGHMNISYRYDASFPYLYRVLTSK